MEEELLEDFPKLSDSQLRDLTLGVYQLKQAKSYTQEHVSSEGNYEFTVHKEEPGLIRVRIQSRHSSSKSYLLWVSYNTDQDEDCITGWYCQCKAGARTVGCCAHIASVLWYLGYQRHCSDALVAGSDPAELFLNAADDDWDSDEDDKASE